MMNEEECYDFDTPIGKSENTLPTAEFTPIGRKRLVGDAHQEIIGALYQPRLRSRSINLRGSETTGDSLKENGRLSMGLTFK
jgi:hypothetical protein